MATTSDSLTITTGTSAQTSSMTLNSNGTVTGSEGNPPKDDINTDVIYQEFKLYIEGVQVPFQSISISQSIGNYPSANISVPPQAGLMDIARYYQPKVHIFYTDHVTGGDRLLFWGHITAVNYSRSRNPASSYIEFSCLHKNGLMNLITLDYGGYGNTPYATGTDTNPNQSALKVDNLTSTLSIVNALTGVTGVQSDPKDLIDVTNTNISDADSSKLPKKFQAFEGRYKGMPGSIINFWNQLKKQVFVNPAWSTIMSQLYIPLVEDGLKYFDRISGHSLVENLVDSGRQQYCPHDIPANAVKNPILIPPSRKLSSISAIQAALTVNSAQSQLQYSGELSDFIKLLSDFYYSVDYEMITLASPAAVPADPGLFVDPDTSSTWSSADRMSIETIVKPQTPFYYSPVCNVIFPQMFSSISVNQNEAETPTRVTVYSDMIPTDGGQLSSYYRAPGTVREAVAVGISLTNAAGAQQDINLLNTTGSSYNVPGKYEEGRGIIHKKIIMPDWLAHYVTDQAPNVGDPTAESWPDKGSKEYQSMVDLHEAWVDKYGYDITENDGQISRTRNTNKDVLDPNAVQSKIHPFQRLLFASADYEFTKQISQSRSGNIDMVFNPYIIPGYPMDVIDSSPNYPCFHAVCASVTHTITSRSVNTTVGFIGAMTYAELSNYYIPPVHPWLMQALNVINVQYDTSNQSQNSSALTTAINSISYGDGGTVKGIQQTLINNPNALQAANDYYKSTLGIGAADPSLLYDFSYGQPSAVLRQSGEFTEGIAIGFTDVNYGQQNDYMSTVGNLRLVSRQIEGKEAIKAKFGVQFVELLASNYTQNGASYTNPILDKSILLEPGASLFLDYQETKDFINETQLESEIKNNTTK